MMTDYEFYSPFVHIPGRYEWCRIHSATHGSFDCFIVIHEGTDKPVTVYVASEHGAAFMADRFPESAAIRVAATELRLQADGAPGGDWVVQGGLTAHDGPLIAAEMTFRAPAVDSSGGALPRAVPYGGRDFPVWGSRWRCEGVDLELAARVEGYVAHRGAVDREELTGTPGVLTLGSYGALRRVRGA